MITQATYIINNIINIIMKKQTLKNNNSTLIIEKNNDYKKDNELTIVETFVGAGGAHLGFKNAGFTSLLVLFTTRYAESLEI